MSESPTEFHEHTEHAMHAHHASEGGNPIVGKVAMTIAVLAVVAATVGSLETLETGAAISAKNDAVLLQNKATDNWNFFQAKSVKKNMYEIAAANAPEGPVREDFVAKGKKNSDESDDIQKEAKKLEVDSDAKLQASEVHEHRHHILTIAVTLLHVSIAIATISIIAGGKRWPWFTSILLGLVGVAATATAYAAH